MLLKNDELNERVRLVLYKLRDYHPSDGFVQGVPVEKVKNSDQTEQVCDRLVELKVLGKKYKLLGLDKFKGHVDFDRDTYSWGVKIL